MKIAVIGASGQSGSLIVKEALAKNHEVTAIDINKNTVNHPKVNVIVKDALELTYSDLQPYDVIINALGFWDDVEQHIITTKHFLSLLENQLNRIIFVGGAGSLYANPEHTIRLVDTPDFPDKFKPVATAMAKAFDEVLKANNVNWTYISPAPLFLVDAPRTGGYQLGQDEVIVNSQGEAAISYADYAIAVIDEAESGKHLKQRFTVVGQ